MKAAMVQALHDSVVALSHAKKAATTGETRQPAGSANCDIVVMIFVRFRAFLRDLWRRRKHGYGAARVWQAMVRCTMNIPFSLRLFC